jgi:hyperosmotically inducible periplasmic protein
MVKRLLALVIVVGLVGVAVYLWNRRHPGTRPEQALAYVGDKIEATKVAGEVKAALALDRELKPYPIDVDGQADGAVVLRGAVSRDDLRGAAERVAGAAPSVRRVINELRVDPALPGPNANDRTLGENLDDRALEAKVKLAFSLNRNLKGTDIKVAAFRRQVTLGGTVDTPAQRQLAVEIAQRTPAVAGVSDQIATPGPESKAVPPASGSASTPPAAAPVPAPPPAGGAAPAAGTPPAAPASNDPASLAAAAERALRSNPSLGGYGLTVRVQPDGNLVVGGRVRTAAERDLALLLAREAAGRPVQNALQLGQ